MLIKILNYLPETQKKSLFKNISVKNMLVLGYTEVPKDILEQHNQKFVEGQTVFVKKECYVEIPTNILNEFNPYVTMPQFDEENEVVNFPSKDLDADYIIPIIKSPTVIGYTTVPKDLLINNNNNKKKKIDLHRKSQILQFND